MAMYTIYAASAEAEEIETQTQCDTLDEALLHLREIITNELSNRGGGCGGYTQFGIRIEPHTQSRQVWTPIDEPLPAVRFGQ